MHRQHEEPHEFLAHGADTRAVSTDMFGKAVWEVPLPREGRVTGKGLAVPNVPFWMHSTKYEERGMGGGAREP